LVYIKCQMNIKDTCLSILRDSIKLSHDKFPPVRQNYNMITITEIFFHLF